ncbi:hypothetical protein ASPFODRAFT_148707 [Aspergillus luchuensis CBS 106.47]|uniref:Uncharacterized protein n=1 Tax=Aspergillus luchuensis (strain CBS 106.47) TaxID=1137211 RepID=A0A1M3SYZ4_ASPLC|nr:hypothetical protein ASPFODRAFT_148707 [Aspergillus luchuensis CBS 106.47]
MPGQDVEFRRGRITAHQLESRRPSYINACLIQSRGSRPPAPCSRCHARPGTTTFPSCRHLPGAWGGACANCKWSDQASRCSVRDEAWTGLTDGTDAAAQGRGLTGGSVRDPILIEDVEGHDPSQPIRIEEDGDQNDPIIL